MSEVGFTKEVLKAFGDINKEVEKGSSEFDIRYRFVKYFVEGVLGYESIFINPDDSIETKDKGIRDFVAVYLNSIPEKLSKSKEVKSLIYNLPVPKSNDIIGKIGKSCGFDQAEIKEKIKKLEREINELVYEIYGITVEEKTIVEESLGVI